MDPCAHGPHEPHALMGPMDLMGSMGPMGPMGHTVDGKNYASVFHVNTRYGLRLSKRIFHETGPEQRSRAGNRCIRIKIALRIFFVLTMFGKKC